MIERFLSVQDAIVLVGLVSGIYIWAIKYWQYKKWPKK